MRKVLHCITFDISIKQNNAMKAIEFINGKGETVQWGIYFTSMKAAKGGLKYVKANFSKNARIIEI